MTIYVVNLTQTTIGLTGLKAEIPMGEFIELSESQSKHSDVEEALRRKWVKISLTKPGEPEVVKPEIKMTEPAVKGSKTIPKKEKTTT